MVSTDLTSPDQKEVVLAARSGDARALQSLWEQSRRWVAAVLLAHKDRGSDLEDLLQDVALRMVRGIDGLDTPEAFAPWLRQIAVNVARAEGRKKTNRSRLLRLVRPDVATQHEDNTQDAEGLGALEALPEHYREALMLRCVRGMSYRAIGAVTGLPETTIETRIARARRMVREHAAKAEASDGR